MDHTLVFARHFARLVWLLLHEPGNTDEQKATLRALVMVSKDGAVSLALRGEELHTNVAPVPSSLTGVVDVSSQMASHGLAMVMVDAGAAAADVLGVARILAGMPTLGDGGAAVEAKRRALGATTVRFAARPLNSEEIGSLPDMEFGEVYEDPLAEALKRATPRSTRALTALADAHTDGAGGGGGGGGHGGLFAQFAAPRAPNVSLDKLIQQLEGATDAGVITTLLDDLVALAESAVRDGKPAHVSDIMLGVVRCEAKIVDFESKRAFVMALRRLAKPALLRAVAMQMPQRPERREELVAVLIRAGEDGADALIEQISTGAHSGSRGIFFDALVQLKAGVPTLIHMLGDAQWHVARIAADLLGEMQAREAEGPLTELLKHQDDRVRRSASGALMRLGTPKAMQAILDALKSPSPQMRMEAASALVTRKEVRTAAALLKALDVEKDDEVQAAFLVSLGKLGTPDAVQRLVRAAEAERGLFKKKPTALRVAAVQGLTEARTPEALEALRALHDDKDLVVRDAVAFSLGRINRQASVGRQTQG